MWASVFSLRVRLWLRMRSLSWPSSLAPVATATASAVEGLQATEPLDEHEQSSDDVLVTHKLDGQGRRLVVEPSTHSTESDTLAMIEVLKHDVRGRVGISTKQGEVGRHCER